MSASDNFNLSYQDLVSLTPGIFARQPELVDLVETLEHRGEVSHTGLFCLLLATDRNARGEIDEAQNLILEAVRTAPDLMKALVDADNPNHELPLETGHQTLPVSQCPVCGGESRHSVFAGLTLTHPLYHPGLSPVIHWVQCDGCSHLYARETNTPAAFANGPERSSPHMFNADEKRYGYDFESVQHLFGQTSGVRALELGPGGGTRMAALRDLGFDVRAVELRSQVVEHCRGLGLDVVQEDFYEHRSPDDAGYDLIVLGDVIEHLPDLERTFKTCEALLAHGGMLWISTPLFDGFTLEQLRRQGLDPYFGQIEHVHYFTRRSLVELAVQNGFEVRHQRLGRFYLGAMEMTFARTGDS